MCNCSTDKLYSEFLNSIHVKTESKIQMSGQKTDIFTSSLVIYHKKNSKAKREKNWNNGKDYTALTTIDAKCVIIWLPLFLWNAQALHFLGWWNSSCQCLFVYFYEAIRGENWIKITTVEVSLSERGHYYHHCCCSW